MTKEAGVFVPPPDAEVVDTSTLTFWIDAHGILRIVCKPKVAHRAKEAEENMAVFFPRRSGPVLADIRTISSVNREAREIYRAQSGETTAVALVVGSPLSRAIGNFFIGLSRLPYPVRLFTDEVKALEWVRAQSGAFTAP